MFKKVCLGVAAIHRKGFVHRDIKPENILLKNENQPKICDFGWSTEMSSGEKRSTFCGTYEYMAPEIFEKQVYDDSVDIWSLGILLYELFSGKSPFKSASIFKIYRKIIEEEIHFEERIDADARELILLILKTKPENRPSLEQIINHKFITKFDFSYSPLDRHQQPLQKIQKKFSTELFENVNKMQPGNSKVFNSMDDQKLISDHNGSKGASYLRSSNYKEKKQGSDKLKPKKKFLQNTLRAKISVNLAQRKAVPQNNVNCSKPSDPFNLYSIFKMKSSIPPPNSKKLLNKKSLDSFQTKNSLKLLQPSNFSNHRRNSGIKPNINSAIVSIHKNDSIYLKRCKNRNLLNTKNSLYFQSRVIKEKNSENLFELKNKKAKGTSKGPDLKKGKHLPRIKITQRQVSKEREGRDMQKSYLIKNAELPSPTFFPKKKKNISSHSFINGIFNTKKKNKSSMHQKSLNNFSKEFTFKNFRLYLK